MGRKPFEFELTAEQQRLVVENLEFAGWCLMHKCSPVAVAAYGSYMDAFQEAMVGMIYAARKFEPGRELAFTTYAEHWVRQTVYRGSLRAAGIRVPEWALKDYGGNLPLGLFGGNSPAWRRVAVDHAKAQRGAADGRLTDDQEWLLRQLPRLARRQRRYVELTLENKTVAEISQECGVSVQAVRHGLNKARVRLQQLMRLWKAAA